MSEPGLTLVRFQWVSRDWHLFVFKVRYPIFSSEGFRAACNQSHGKGHCSEWYHLVLFLSLRSFRYTDQIRNLSSNFRNYDIKIPIFSLVADLSRRVTRERSATRVTRREISATSGVLLFCFFMYACMHMWMCVRACVCACVSVCVCLRVSRCVCSMVIFTSSMTAHTPLAVMRSQKLWLKQFETAAQHVHDAGFVIRCQVF